MPANLYWHRYMGCGWMHSLMDRTPTPPLYRLANRFRPYGDSLFSNAGRPAPQKSKQKRSAPASGTRRPRLATLDFPHSIIAPRARPRRPPTKGHPWPIAALAASMPLNPLRNDSVRPSEGAIGVCPAYRVEPTGGQASCCPRADTIFIYEPANAGPMWAVLNGHSSATQVFEFRFQYASRSAVNSVISPSKNCLAFSVSGNRGNCTSSAIPKISRAAHEPQAAIRWTSSR